LKRAPFVLAATGAGVGLLLSYHTRPLAVFRGRAATVTPTASTPTAVTPTASTPTASTPGSAATTAPRATPTTLTAPTTPATRSATSEDVVYAYGDLQLEVTETGRRIIALQVLQDGAADPRSAQINSAALPLLEQQALSVQSADIDGVSGATFTSAAFAQALQSALDQLQR
jgi:uncharacterized protein with FMN-binding domain